MIEMISNTAADEVPPRMPGTTRCVATLEKCGLVISTKGTMKKLMMTKTIMKRSQR